MKEIKFRQRNINNGHYHYWGMVDNIWESPRIQDNYTHPQDSDQYIGLKCQNGVELYHHDFIKYEFQTKQQIGFPYTESIDPGWEISEIVYVAPSFKQNIIRQHNSYYGELPHIRNINEFALSKIRVVGNIYENPKLLEN